MTPTEQLLQAARSDDPQVRQQAAMQLGVRHDAAPVTDVVALMLDEPDDFVRETQIWAVVARGKAAVPALVAALDDPRQDPEHILHTLSKIGDPAAVPAILPFADSPERRVAAKAWWALSCIGSDAGLREVLGHLGDDDQDRRLGVTRAVLQFGPAALPELTGALGHSSGPVRVHALQILVRFADPDQYPVGDRRGGTVPEGLTRAREAVLASVAPETDEVLSDLARDADHPRVAAVANEILAARGRA